MIYNSKKMLLLSFNLNFVVTKPEKKWQTDKGNNKNMFSLITLNISSMKKQKRCSKELVNLITKNTILLMIHLNAKVLINAKTAEFISAKCSMVKNPATVKFLGQTEVSLKANGQTIFITE